MKLIKLTLLSLFLSVNTAWAASFTEGADYTRIIPPQPTNSADKIEVVEVFSYGCSHCFRFEPQLERWKKKLADDVDFTYMPAIFRSRGGAFDPTMEVYAQAYYAAEALGVLDKVHMAFFNTIHVDKKPLNSHAAVLKVVEANGVDGKRFEKALTSFSVAAKVRRAKELIGRYRVQATPSMVVNGKYLTSPTRQLSPRNMLKLVDQLIEDERKAK